VILFTENLIHHQTKATDFVIVYADKDDAVVGKELPRQKQPWIHHREPRGMIAATRLWIAGLEIAFSIGLTGELEIGI